MPGGPQEARNFARKRDADRFPIKIDHELAAGTYVDPAQGAITLVDYWGDFVSRRFLAPGTAGLHADSAARVFPLFGRRFWSISAGTTRSSSGPRRPHGAKAEGRITRVARPNLPKARAKVELPTEEELEPLMDATFPRMRMAIELGARAGLRLGADARRPRLKTNDSYRVIPVTAETIAMLPEHTAEPHGVVLDMAGRAWAGTVFGSAWAKLKRRLGLHYRYHDLRLFFCTHSWPTASTPRRSPTPPAWT